jgi:hypothetical protein
VATVQLIDRSPAPKCLRQLEATQCVISLLVIDRPVDIKLDSWFFSMTRKLIRPGTIYFTSY